MNSAEAIIVKYFHPTENHAEKCLAGTPNDLEHANGRDILSVRADALWAVRMIITEEVLLQAFRETEETKCLDTEGLIAVADRKLGNVSFVVEIIDYLGGIKKIPSNKVPCMREIQSCIVQSLNTVKRTLRGGLEAKKSRERKKMEDPGRHFLERLRLRGEDDSILFN